MDYSLGGELGEVLHLTLVLLGETQGQFSVPVLLVLEHLSPFLLLGVLLHLLRHGRLEPPTWGLINDNDDDDDFFSYIRTDSLCCFCKGLKIEYIAGGQREVTSHGIEPWPAAQKSHMLSTRPPLLSGELKS